VKYRVTDSKAESPISKRNAILPTEKKRKKIERKEKRRGEKIQNFRGSVYLP
jgi:hypothetical protein